VDPATTRTTSGEPSHPDAILTPTRDKNPDDHEPRKARERSGLGGSGALLFAFDLLLRDRRKAERAQAELIVHYVIEPPSSRPQGVVPVWSITVRNHSNLPITDVSLIFSGKPFHSEMETSKKGKDASRYRSYVEPWDIPELLPGDFRTYEIPLPQFDKATPESHFGMSGVDQASLYFRDATGRKWRKDSVGGDLKRSKPMPLPTYRRPR
jgi:hypothetical protein